MTFLKYFTITILILSLVVAAFAAGYWFNSNQASTTNFLVIKQAYQLLKDHGLKEIPSPPVLEYGMIRGMLQAYDDPFTVFVEPAQHELEGDSLHGSFGGIGVRLEKGQDGQWYLYPFPDGPAKKVGILDGDRLLAVDELKIDAETSLEVIQAAVRGPVGSRVTISISRSGQIEPVAFEIERTEIPLPSVTWNLVAGEPQVGMVIINLIASSTAQEIERAIQELTKDGATHFILDLRNNPGGLLTAGVDIARMFLKEGVILEQQYRGKEKETFRVEKPGAFAEIPMVVLINENSASAAEIIVGALKAHQRAKLVGTRSFGKDSIQLVYDLRDRSSLHVTAAKWWVPGLTPPVGEAGIEPDFSVESSSAVDGADLFIQAAIRVLLDRKSD